MSGAAPELPSRALVLGLARSGQAAARALAGRGVGVLAVDRNEQLDVGDLGEAGVEIRLREVGEEALDDVELVVKSPGVPAQALLVRAARARGIPIWSEVELGYRLLRPRPFIGVTGTKGKTTTTELIGAMLAAAGRPVEVTGNVASPGSSRVPITALDPPRDAWIVAELSSFQLEDVHELELEVAVLLNLEPDHLDRHGTFESYRDAKLRIFERARHKVAPRGFGIDGAIEFAGDDPLPAEPRIPGAHNRANAAAATAAARAVGFPDEAIAQALEQFTGVPHRLELIRERGGVRWVNDSIATNTLAVRHGIAAYDAPVRLILGGRAKGEDYAAFARELPARVSSIYLVGEATDELAAVLAAAGREFTRAGTIAGAVELAARAAKQGDVVLLSPACASYDQYANFEERGEDFRRLVQNLPE
ncbi:MAG: UDP-N-acetylmuramoylalanine--D-glutamate ligase [Gaiellaceae bacterium]|nr:UDP-N-acetylmuramoylalanine--D-glutamate ligase [Gaiellaceae bacterium]